MHRTGRGLDDDAYGDGKMQLFDVALHIERLLIDDTGDFGDTVAYARAEKTFDERNPSDADERFWNRHPLSLQAASLSRRDDSCLQL